MKTGNLKAVQAFLPLTTNLNAQMIVSGTALSEAPENGHTTIVEALLDARAEIEPQEPEPHCCFLDPKERRSIFGDCAYIAALLSKHRATFRTILSFVAQREPQSVHAIVLRSLDADAGSTPSFEASVQALKEAIEREIDSLPSEESGMASMARYLGTFAEDPFRRFAACLLFKFLFKQYLNRDFIIRNGERADATIRERKQKIVDKLQLQLSQLEAGR